MVVLACLVRRLVSTVRFSGFWRAELKKAGLVEAAVAEIGAVVSLPFVGLRMSWRVAFLDSWAFDELEGMASGSRLVRC